MFNTLTGAEEAGGDDTGPCDEEEEGAETYEVIDPEEAPTVEEAERQLDEVQREVEKRKKEEEEKEGEKNKEEEEGENLTDGGIGELQYIHVHVCTMYTIACMLSIHVLVLSISIFTQHTHTHTHTASRLMDQKKEGKMLEMHKRNTYMYKYPAVAYRSIVYTHVYMNIHHTSTLCCTTL